MTSKERVEQALARRGWTLIELRSDNWRPGIPQWHLIYARSGGKPRMMHKGTLKALLKAIEEK